MSDTQSLSGASDREAQPRRLHPATMLIAIVRGAPATLLGIPTLLAVAARADLWLVLAGTGAAFLIGGAARWLAWSRFTYALTADEVVIESGVFSRNRRTIPYERVADVSIESRLLQRLFGLATVTLETGGAGTDQGALNSVSVAEAERLRGILRERRTNALPNVPVAVGIEPQASAPSTGIPLFAMDTRRVLIAGVFNFSLVWIAVGFGALQYLDGPLGLDSRVVWDAIVARTGSARSMPVSAWAGALLAGTAIILGIGVAAGLTRTMLREHGFALADEHGRLRRKRGLFTRSEAIVSLPRVQLAAIDDGPLRRRLGWSRLRAQVLGGEGAGGRQDLAPLARADEVDTILDVLRLRRSRPDELQTVARGHVWRTLLRRAGLPAVLIIAASLVQPLALLASPLLLPLIATALLGRRHHRYRLTSGLLQVQRGAIGRQTWIVPVARIQVVTLQRSWLQRRLGTASVLVDTAGGGHFGGPHVHDLRGADAWTLVAGLCRT